MTVKILKKNNYNTKKWDGGETTEIFIFPILNKSSSQPTQVCSGYTVITNILEYLLYPKVK